jgi:RNA polymerase sigma factor (sigma-70 family)
MKMIETANVQNEEVLKFFQSEHITIWKSKVASGEWVLLPRLSEEEKSAVDEFSSNCIPVKMAETGHQKDPKREYIRIYNGKCAEWALMKHLGLEPPDMTIGDSRLHMGKDIDQFHKERTQARRFETYSMEVVTEEVMSIATDSSQQPEAIVEHEQFMGVLTDAIGDLPERDQLLMNLYYVEELNLKEIGEVLGVTESRVSQLLTAVVKKLRATLKVEPVNGGKTKAGKL